MHRLTSALVAALLLPATASAQQFTHPGKITALSAPHSMDTTGRFQAAIARVGDDVFVGGQPTELGLREMKAAGVTTIVNLRTPEEMAKIPFDERALAAQLGMKYVNLPVRGTAEFPYSPETVTKFTEAVAKSNGKVLLHCTIGWRASHLWAAYLIRERGVPVDEALANARAINLMDTRRIGNSTKQPVEEFLGRTLPSLGRP
jgi:uncharacterized protein (TIGR01244 family)